MTDSKQHGPEAHSLEGRIFRPANPKELAEAVEQAFDYRGDITLVLATGATIEGYLFNRTPTGSRPFLQIFPKGRSDERMIEYADIASIAFSGKDTASGKSWESWVEKKESQRRIEAEQAAAEAKARGHL
nr:hypothetical protein [Nitrospirota bacterium]